MADKPIIFSGPMIRALLDGTKTQTRRALKPQPDTGARFSGFERDGHALFTKGSLYGKQRLRYAPGDRLWVREAWRTIGTWDDVSPRNLGSIAPIRYEADAYINQPDYWQGRSEPVKYGRYRHARFMPRRASRLTLTVTDVRVQRLQEISEADARAEGVSPITEPNDLKWEHYAPHGAAFVILWNSINGPGAWDANPWVAAYTFTARRGNIDQPEAAHG